MLDGPGSTAYALVTMRGDSKRALADYPGVRSRLHSDRLEIACTGHLPFMENLDRTLEHDLLRAEIVSMPLALFVLLFVFRTVVAAALPVGVGGLAVVGGIAIVLQLSHVTDIAQYTINVCSLIGLGVAIDYSLFMVSRYREELAAGRDRRDAIVHTMGTAGRVVGFSGVAVGTGLSGLLFFEGSYLRSMGIGGAIVGGARHRLRAHVLAGAAGCPRERHQRGPPAAAEPTRRRLMAPHRSPRHAAPARLPAPDADGLAGDGRSLLAPSHGHRRRSRSPH